MSYLVGIGIAGVLATIVVIACIVAMCYRVVVSTNDVHIVQSAKQTISYGRGEVAGNTYYAWPAWMPLIGIKWISLPVSVFDVKLDSYAAYDKGRVPFAIDIMAFFRVTDSNLAAQRVFSFAELQAQLQGILQGACRTILASSEIEEILEGRSKFGEMFTKEVDHNLAQWGVQTVKMIELMDIRDASNSKVIESIMAKKKSLIDMQSRVEVANNQKIAQEAEINAQQSVMVRKQEAEQMVGIRTAEKERVVGINNQVALQDIKEAEKVTAEKDMAVAQVQRVREAEIARQVQLVEADQVRQTTVIRSDAERQATVLTAQGDLEKAQLHAQGVKVEGEAAGAAEQAVLMAPVNAQITLAKEIGENANYQEYLIKIKVVEKDQAVGIAQAEALKDADLKVIANSGSVNGGVNSLLDTLSPNGGTQVGGMLEALANTPVGKSLLDKFIGTPKAS